MDDLDLDQEIGPDLPVFSPELEQMAKKERRELKQKGEAMSDDGD
jgi:hypothetical protein